MDFSYRRRLKFLEKLESQRYHELITADPSKKKAKTIKEFTEKMGNLPI